VVRAFRLPEGASKADLDAASDPDSGLLVVVDLRPDDDLQAAGLAREARRPRRGPACPHGAGSATPACVRS